MSKKEIFMCECGTEGIIISDLLKGDKDFQEIDVALFGYLYNVRALDFWGKLRWCWNVLMTGEPWTDQVILDYNTARKLGKRLLELTEEVV